MNYVQERQAKGEVVTGLLYVDPDAHDLHEHFNTTEVPINRLGATELSPGAATLGQDQQLAALRPSLRSARAQALENARDRRLQPWHAWFAYAAWPRSGRSTSRCAAGRRERTHCVAQARDWRAKLRDRRRHLSEAWHAET